MIISIEHLMPCAPFNVLLYLNKFSYNTFFDTVTMVQTQ